MNTFTDRENKYSSRFAPARVLTFAKKEAFGNRRTRRIGCFQFPNYPGSLNKNRWNLEAVQESK